jgi:hypothetical protein
MIAWRPWRAAAVLGAALLASSCCGLRVWRFGTPRDHLCAYVFVGFDAPSKCAAPRSYRRITPPDTDVPLWVRSVFADNIRRRLPSARITFDVIEASTGNVAAEATVTPASIVTDQEGVNSVPVRFRAKHMNVYRIRARYPDRTTSAVSYSELVFVQRLGLRPQAVNPCN